MRAPSAPFSSHKNAPSTQYLGREMCGISATPWLSLKVDNGTFSGESGDDARPHIQSVSVETVNSEVVRRWFALT